MQVSAYICKSQFINSTLLKQMDPSMVSFNFETLNNLKKEGLAFFLIYRFFAFELFKVTEVRFRALVDLTLN